MRDQISPQHMVFLLLFLFVFLSLVVVGIGLSLVLVMIGAIMTDVPYLPVHHKLLPAVIDALELRPCSIIYDLGSGDSAVLRAIVKSESTSRGVGIELSPFPYFIARMWNVFRPLPQLTLLRKNFFDVSVTDATHIFLYLLSPVMDKLLPKLVRELKPGARVVSCDFQFKDKTPSATIPIHTSKNRIHKLYLYQF